MSNVADLDVIVSLPVPDDRRSASIDPALVLNGVDDSVLSMSSGTQTVDVFSTVVDLISPLAHAHFLLLEGGSGYMVLEDRGKVVIF